MGYFNKNRSGGGRENYDSGGSRGGRDDRRGGGGGGRGSYGGDKEMHHAVCDACNVDCKVPFKPSSGKPIYCSNCFEKENSFDSGGSRGGRDDRRGGRDDRGTREMYNTICSDCGESCEVPFKPRGDKPVLCSHCFEGSSPRKSEKSNGKNDEILSKLDEILSLLKSCKSAKGKDEEPKKAAVKEEVEEKPKKVTKKAVKKEKKEEKPKKVVKKKAAVKKAAAKKTTKAKKA